MRPLHPPSSATAIAALAAAGVELARHGLSDDRVRAFIGTDRVCDARYLLPQLRARPRLFGPSALLHLFVTGLPIARRSLPLTDASLDALGDAGLVDFVSNEWIARCSIVPLEGLLIAADRLDCDSALATHSPDISAWNLAASLPFRLDETHRVLDVGCGAGPTALVAARRGCQVIAGDLDPRAIDFARVNAALNGLADRPLEFHVADLFPDTAATFDLIAFNAPLAAPADPEHPTPLYLNCPEGDALTERFLNGAAARLNPLGEVLLHTQWTPRIERAAKSTAWRSAVLLHFLDSNEGLPHVLASLRAPTPDSRSAPVLFRQKYPLSSSLRHLRREHIEAAEERRLSILGIPYSAR